MTSRTGPGRADHVGVLATLRRDMVTYVDQMTDRAVDRALIADGVLRRLVAIEQEAAAQALADAVERVAQAMYPFPPYNRGEWSYHLHDARRVLGLAAPPASPEVSHG